MPEQIRVDTPRVLEQAQTELSQVSAETGQYRGHTVQAAPSASSLLQDALEELTLTAEEEVEKKTLEEYEKGGHARTESRLIKMIERLREMVPDMGRSQELERFIANLRRMKGAGKEDLLKYARQSFKDPSHQFLALQTAEEFFDQEEETKGLASEIREARQQLEAEEGPSIRAGINISRTAEQSEKSGVGDMQELRDLYRAHVLGFSDIIQSYEAIETQYGMKKFGDTVQFLLRAISADIEAQNPSTEPAELKQVHDDLFSVRLLGNIHDDIEGLLSRVGREFGIKPQQSAGALMKAMVGLLKQQFVSDVHFRAILDHVGIARLDARIDFLREWNNEIKKLPLKVYQQPDQRAKLVSTGQVALDALVAEEEEGAW